MTSVDRYEGSLVEIDCSVLGVYQGVIQSVNEIDQSVSICKASKNGKKLFYSDVIIEATDIVNIRFLNKKPRSPPVLKERNNSSNGFRSPLKTPRLEKESKSRPRTFSNSLSTSRASRDKECFGAESDKETLLEDFDFEKNLELFNKEKVFAEINKTQDPNVVRLADCNIRKEKKYRHDENVLSNADKIIQREEKRSSIMFSVGTSDAQVPAVTRSKRDQILLEATKLGISVDSLREAMSRDICSIILQQNNRNSVVFVLSPEKVSGPMNISLCGITAARQLAGKVKNVYVVLSRSLREDDVVFRSEVDLCEMAGVKVMDASVMATLSVDLVVGCTLHPYLDQCANLASTRVVLVDPPFYSANLADFVLFPLLPLQSSVPVENDSKCKMYIGDLGIPGKLYEKVCATSNGIYPKDGFVSRIKRA